MLAVMAFLLQAQPQAAKASYNWIWWVILIVLLILLFMRRKSRKARP